MRKKSTREIRVKECLLAAASTALALEPLSWRGAGTVSRLKDHRDKRLVDYIAYSHRLPLVYRQVCEHDYTGCGANNLFLSLVRDMKYVVATNLSLGTFLHLSLHLAPLYRIELGSYKGPLRNMLTHHALSEAMRFPFKAFLEGLAEVSPRYAGRMKAWLFIDIGEPFPRSKDIALWWIARALSNYDPVLREVYEGWRVSRRLAGDLASRIGTGIPGSDDVDWLFSRACSLLGVDYLAFRRRGLQAMKDEVSACALGKLESVKTSLGSVADVVVMGIFYYLAENCFSDHCYMT